MGIKRHTLCRNVLRPLFLVVAASTLSACVTPLKQMASPNQLHPAKVNPSTITQDELKQLPAPSQKVAIAVYGFDDKTGQFKQSATGQTLSRAVTQGPTSILVKALQDAGTRKWFDVVERENLDNLLNERNIIREMRQRYLGENTVNPQALPPLMFAGVLLEGGIISYDTNTKTGGLGARYLGIGGNVEYREDTVTVYLRAVSTKTGAVLSNVTTSQRIASVGLAANAFRFIAFQDLLEVDSGVTVNQPTQLAVQQAVEKAVYAMIMDGVDSGLWSFADPRAGQTTLNNFHRRNSPEYVEKVLAERPELNQPNKSKTIKADPPKIGAIAQLNNNAVLETLEGPAAGR